MQTISEQMSLTGRAQFQAQLELFNTIAIAAIENTGRLALFQLDASRTALDRACAAWSQILSGGPRTLMETMSKAQSGLAETAGTTPGQASADQANQHDRRPATDALPTQPIAPMVTEPHAPQPPAQRTPIAEAAAEVVAEGQASVPIVAAHTELQDRVTLPKVQPAEASPFTHPHSEGAGRRKGAPPR